MLKRFRGSNQVSPVVEPTPTEGEKMLKKVMEKDDKEDFDQNLKSDSKDLAGKINESFKQKQQKEQEKGSVEIEKGEVEGLAIMSKKMNDIIVNSLDRIKNQVESYGIGHDEDLFSKQVKDLQIKLESLENKLNEIKGEIGKKEQEIGEMKGQQGIIDLLIHYNQLVRVNNKMRDNYNGFRRLYYEKYSPDLKLLFDQQDKEGIGDIEGEVPIPGNDTERKKLYETMKGEQKLSSIDKTTDEIKDKFTKLELLVKKFDHYSRAEKNLIGNSNKIINLKRQLEEYKQKKAHLQGIKEDIEIYLHLDKLEGYETALPKRVVAFMDKLTKLDKLSEDVKKNIDDELKLFEEAKRELADLGKLDFVDKMDKNIQNVKYVGDLDLEIELGTIGDFKAKILQTFEDSVKRLIFTSFINGIQKSNLDYDKDENGKEYFIAYIYTLVYDLGNISRSTVLVDFNFDRTTITDLKKQNGIEAHKIEGIKNLNVDDFPVDDFPLTNLEGFVFNDELELLERKHVAFLKRYKGSVTNDLLYDILDVIVGAATNDGFIPNINDAILPFYKQIIKTNAEREAETEEENKIGFTKADFDYYLSETPYVDGDDLFRKMEEFKTNYTGEFGEGATEQELTELTRQINDNALSQFINKYNDKKNFVGLENGTPKKPGRDDSYITVKDYEAFIDYLDTKIPLPESEIPDVITVYGNEAGSHADVLTEILVNLPVILNHRDSGMLSEFRSWFFLSNSVRNQGGINTFAANRALGGAAWYINHIEKLEQFLERLISKRFDYLQAGSQGSSQPRTNFIKRYNIPLIDPTKFQSPEIMDECRAVAFLKVLLGDDFNSICVDGSWDSVNPSELPKSNKRRTKEQLCGKFKEYIQGDDPGKKVSIRKELSKFRPDIQSGADSPNLEGGIACKALSDWIWMLFKDKEFSYCKPATGGSQKRRKDTRRKRKDTRRKRKDTRRKLRKDTRRKIRKDTRRKKKDTRRKTRK